MKPFNSYLNQIMAEQNDRPLRLLSLDGGGVKGITSLRILQAIFKKLSEEAGHEVKPCEYFDVIGGTSTGGYDPSHSNGRCLSTGE